MPAVAKSSSDQAKTKRKKKSKIKKKPRVLKLKGWLKTPEDWAKFDAWVRLNALPRTLPDPEPVIRKAVPLRRLKKRLKVLSKPTIRPVTQCANKEISCAALYGKVRPRIKELAFPKIRITPDQCNEPGVKKSALTYKTTEHTIWLSQPKIRPIAECRSPYEVSRGALKRKSTERDDELARPSKRRKLNDECKDTEKKCEKDEELSPWMEFLVIPSYRRLMGQETEQAQQWREQIIEELELRGKQAYEEQMKKREEQKRLDEQKQLEEQKRCEEDQKQLGEEEKSLKLASQRVRLICEKENDNEDQEDEADEDEYEDAIGDEEGEDEDKKSESLKISETNGEEEEETEEEKEARIKRKKENNAWRFEAVGTCKEFPPIIPDSAKNYEATPAIKLLAEPKKYKSKTCKDPYKISEKAKSAQASPATEALAKPKYTAEPVQRPLPREKDEFGMPIFPKPAFGKVLPKPEPYPEAECKTEEEQEEKRKEKQEETKKKKIPIDKIAEEPTIDPMFDPRAAKRQAKERERAAQNKAEKEAAEKEAAEGTDTETAGDETANTEAEEE